MVYTFGDVHEMESDARGNALDQRHSYVPYDLAIVFGTHWQYDLQPAMGKAYSCEGYDLTLVQTKAHAKLSV
jgi:hypothetical protein